MVCSSVLLVFMLFLSAEGSEIDVLFYESDESSSFFV